MIEIWLLILIGLLGWNFLRAKGLNFEKWQSAIPSIKLKSRSHPTTRQRRLADTRAIQQPAVARTTWHFAWAASNNSYHPEIVTPTQQQASVADSGQDYPTISMGGQQLIDRNLPIFNMQLLVNLCQNTLTFCLYWWFIWYIV